MTNLTKAFAILFPGQGSQSVGMLTSLSETHSSVEATFKEASDTLGYDLWQLVKEGPSDVLDQTEYTQPALVATGVAIWRIWQQEVGLTPSVMAGHSLGEYTALVCADALNFKDALILARLRGRLMQQAVQPHEGAMAAIIGLSDQTVETLCLDSSDTLSQVCPANYNADGQLVIAGHTAAVDRAVERAKDAGAKLAKRLNVSVPSHCHLMEPIAQQLAEALELIDVRHPKIPVIQNVEAAFADCPKAIRAMLVRQVYQPVRWTATLRKLAALHSQLLIECGPGKVLTGLARRTAPVLPCLPAFDDTSFAAATLAVRQLS